MSGHRSLQNKNVKSRFDREIEERFLRHARIDTQSDEKSTAAARMDWSG